jgi:hypothetical protein
MIASRCCFSVRPLASRLPTPISLVLIIFMIYLLT